MWDYDVFSSNDLIGLTTIDLEDRWFDEKWHDYGNALVSFSACGGSVCGLFVVES